MNSKQEEEKHAEERRTVEGFLKTLHAELIEVKPYDRPNNKPDVVVTLRRQTDSNAKRVGIEVTRHFNDESSGNGSPGQAMNRFWESVRREIERLKAESGELQQIYVRVELRKDALSQRSLKSLEKKLAKEMFAFVLKESAMAASKTILIPDWTGERVFTVFTDYPLMKRYVAEVTMRKVRFFSFWDANVNAAAVGINLTQLAEVIREKGEKAKGWSRDPIDELWLLVAAPHDNVFNAMHGCPDQVDFGHPDVTAACANSFFDKVFFWSSAPDEWSRQIWPPEMDNTS